MAMKSRVIILSTAAILAVSTHSTFAQAPRVEYLDQGWNDARRQAFYTTGQGSRLMPYAWFKALRRLDMDAAFADDQLGRYGYLANAASARNPEALPVGFVINGSGAKAALGMTCAACHTGQFEFEKDGVRRAFRVDGAPAASVDFQQFLTDLTTALRATMAEPPRFERFARDVLGSGYTASKAAALKNEFGIWLKPFGDFMDKSLPTDKKWGPGRLDAFGMIFNRATALDLKVPANFRKADAPVSYPFVWNASRQNKTQWNGAVPNGTFVQALARNTGEVLGVFAEFAPRVSFPEKKLFPTIVNYAANSVDHSGLQALEEAISGLKPPRWPRELFGYDAPLAARGKPLFEQHCASCHEVKILPTPLGDLWNTPVQDVKTDPKMAENARRKGDPGLLTGALLAQPSLGGERLRNPALTTDILANEVIGVIVAEALRPLALTDETSGVTRALKLDFERLSDPAKIESFAQDPIRYVEQRVGYIKRQLAGLLTPPPTVENAAYESRVLHGIWATAPYLHNGSAPNLWQLLKPSDRAATFKTGSRTFDPKNVGFVTTETPSPNGTFVVGNGDGNGNGGHVYGAELTDDERWALIEYLKTIGEDE